MEENEKKYNPEEPENSQENTELPEYCEKSECSEESDYSENSEFSENSDCCEKSEKFKVEKEWAERLGIDFDPTDVPEPPRAPQQEPPQYRQAPPQPPIGQPPFGWQPYQQPGYDPQPDLYPAGQPDSLPPMHPNGPMPPTYMVWAIISTICCCLPAGIVAIVYSSSVSSKYFARDYEGARRASRRAEIWIIVSIVTGVIINALYLPLSLMFQP